MKYLFQQIFIFLLVSCSVQKSMAQKAPPFLTNRTDLWVDSTLKRMTTEQKIGQLFMVQAYSNDESPTAALLREVKNYQVGGVLFMQGNALNQVRIINELQRQSTIPLLVATDAEWGPGFRLKGAPKYPVQLALGAIQQDSLIYQMGYEIGLQLKRTGVNINFAPVADVNNNPDNPVINYRSFGEDPENVSRKAWLYAKGMQDAGILAVAKHFPGHGDTRVDSHLGLPVIGQNTDRLNRVELYPFRELINKGIGGIMTGHLQVPALEPEPALPSSLSPTIIKNLLIGSYGFQGLIITDAMNMQGVSNHFTPGEAAVRALQAGNDMLEVVPDLNKAINAVKKALQEGKISEAEIEWKCRKILAFKKWVQLNQYQPIPTEGLLQYLENPRYNLTRRLLHEQSLTLLRNNRQLLPLQRLDTLKIAVVSIGKTSETEFQKMSAQYKNVDFFNLREYATPQETERLIKLLSTYNLLICGIHNLSLSPAGRYGTDPSIADFIKKTATKKRIMVLLGNPYALNDIPGIEKTDALLVTYQENRITEELSAQAIFGAVDVNGRLPVNVNAFFKLNDGLNIKKNDRLKYTDAEETGISSLYLKHGIDSLAELGLQKKAYPGCQVLIAKDGKVIFHQCYGYHTYDSTSPVKPEDLYDLASITKITGPVPALIRLYSEGKFKLDIPFSTYWPAFLGTNKATITSRQMLAHQARLRPGISFWRECLLKDGELDPLVFNDRPTSQFNVRVSSHLYMNKENIAKMYELIRDSKLLSSGKYTYSDLAFFLFPQVIEDLAGVNYETYLKKTFYQPLGASTITYNPYKLFPLSQLIPTEDDDFFRHELMIGFVHDEGASMMGGVSGNAGLFSTTNDLAKVMQMYLQKGYYGGQYLLDPTSLAEFTKVQYPENNNRRGLGFDKPYINNFLYRPENAYPAADASPESYGHSGYTGTFTWADPQKKILFIFMSNRVYPTRNNSRLSDLNIRSSMLQVIYDSIKRGLSNY